MNLQTKCPASRLVNEDNFNWIAMSMSSVPKEDRAEPEISCSNRFRILFRKATTYMKSLQQKKRLSALGVCLLSFLGTSHLNLRQGRLIQVILWWRLRWGEPASQSWPQQSSHISSLYLVNIYTLVSITFSPHKPPSALSSVTDLERI